MNYTNIESMKKLKPNYSIVGLLPAIISLLVLALVSVIFGIESGFKVLGLIICIYSFFLGFWFYLRTKNIHFLVVFFYMFFFSLLLFSIEVPQLDGRLGLNVYAKIFLVLMYFFGLWLIFLLGRKKIKWKGREVMELAAREVEEGEGSYTERPKPFDKIDINRFELIDFAKFLNRNLIFLTNTDENGITMMPIKEGKEYSLIFGDPSLPDNTWIKIDNDGRITLKVSQQDYLDYKYDLSFDQLTESLGNLIKEFALLFKKGEEVRILDKINTVKVGYFS